MASENSASVLAFWRDAGPTRWFRKDAAFDDACRLRFAGLCRQAGAGELVGWRGDAGSALALVLLLDQIPRNIHRGSAQAWASDPLARDCATAAIDRGFDREVGEELRSFFYLPLEHSEAIADQHRAVELFRQLGDADLLHWAEIHRDIIARFGRFPHRNALLGRESSAEEQEWLASDDAFKG